MSAHFFVVCVNIFVVVVVCRHLSTVLGNRFDHGAEAIVPVLFNLIPNCAKVMATSGTAAIRIIIRVRNSEVLMGVNMCLISV